MTTSTLFVLNPFIIRCCTVYILLHTFCMQPALRPVGTVPRGAGHDVAGNGPHNSQHREGWRGRGKSLHPGSEPRLARSTPRDRVNAERTCCTCTVTYCALLHCTIMYCSAFQIGSTKHGALRHMTVRVSPRTSFSKMSCING